AESLAVAAPAVWLFLLSFSITYDPWRGRFFIFPVALSASTWGRVLRWQSVSAGVVAIAATTALLSLVHSYQKPSGLQLLARNESPSVWGEPRWQAQSAIRPEMAPVLRYLENAVPRSARVALALGADDWGYPEFGARLTRTVVLVPSENQLGSLRADWLVVSPERQL